MSYNGSGTFVVNSVGQPVVTGTVISSTAFNALTADLATGLSTAITKDGQTTTTARILFAQGISSTLTTDATSSTTGSIITAGGISCQKALNVGTTTTLGGALTYGGVTLSNAVTGTGNMVLSASPTLSGTVGGNLTWSGTQTFQSALTYGGVTLSNAVTGTGNMVLSASPTLTGTLTAAAANFSGKVQIGGAVTGSNFGAKGASSGTAVSEFVAYDTTTTTMTTWARSDSAVAAALIYDGTGFMSLGTTTAHPLKLKYNNTDGITIGSGLVTLSTAINYGGVTLSNSVTGTGSMVLSASPTLTGTLTAAAANFSGAVTQTIGSTSRMSVVSTLNGAEVAFVFTGKDSGGAANSYKLGLGITGDSAAELYDVTNSALVFRYIRGGNFSITPAVAIGNTYTGGAPAATGYVTITCNGVAYKFLVST
jgi:hypothetical protein